jgi:hypothetical protein
VGRVSTRVVPVSELLAVLSAADLAHAAALAERGRAVVPAELLARVDALLAPALREVLAGPAGALGRGPDGPQP